MARQTEAQQAGVLVWGQVAARISKALAPLLIVRLLGQAEVGAFAGLMLVYTTVVTVLTAGVPRTLLYFFAGREQGERLTLARQISRLMVVLGFATASVLALIGLVGNDVADVFRLYFGSVAQREAGTGLGSVLHLLPLLGIYALFDVPVRVLPNLLLAEGRTRSSAGFSLINSLGVLCATLIPIALGFGVPGVFVGLVGWGFANVLVYLAFLRALYRDVTPVPTEATLRDLFRNSIPLGATDIVNTLNGGLDLWLIIIFFSTVEVAEYQQGAWQIPIITTIAYSLGSVYLPRYALLYREGKYAEVIALWRQSTEKVALIVVPASLIFFVAAEELITLFFTDAYLGAAPVFQCYTLLTMGRVTAFGNLMVAAGRPRDVLKSSFLTLLSTVALSVPLVMTVGFLGPALGTALSYIPAVTIYCWFIAKAYNVRLRDTFPGVAYFKVVAAAIPACWLAWQIKEVTELHAAVEIGMIAAIVGIVYAITATVAGLIGRAEWKIARDFIALRVLR